MTSNKSIQEKLSNMSELHIRGNHVRPEFCQYLHQFKLLLLVLSLFFVENVQADNLYDGIFITTSGGTVCYKLSDIPVITYSPDKTIAYISLNKHSEPIMSIPLDNTAALQIIFGTYTSDSMEKVTITEKNNRKYISGGKLIIVKDNQLYNINGTLIK